VSVPHSTYRLQLHRGFPFRAAAEQVAYLRELGVGAAYLSPLLAAQPGSTHGYDVCDPERVNPELGGEEGLAALARTLREAGLGCVADFVPNHMGADATHNAWWRDVLEKGPASSRAEFFDIDWSPPKAGLRGKVLLPVLGDAYGRVLEHGELRLAADGDRLVLCYFDRVFPLCAATVAAAASAAGADPGDPEAIAAALNGTHGDAASFDGLHALLELQAYRLANWKTAVHEINYRRFFDVNELLGLRVEEPRVFEALHALVLRLACEGVLTGLRLDHVDGLRNPRGYLKDLRARLEEAAEARRDHVAPFYLVVEKILCGEEELRADWPVQGTTGYEFLNDLNLLFVDPAGLGKLRRLYHRFTGRTEPVGAEERACKRLILSTSLASELNALAVRLDRLSESDRTWRDFTLEALREALREVIAWLGVYRTYGDDSGFDDGDEAAVEAALRGAMRDNPAIDPSVFDFLRLVLLPREDDAGRSLPIKARRDFAMKFQQLTGPAQAKGVEDTVFYRQAALLSINEVGGGPGSGGLVPADFHRRVAARAARFPHGMLATATHDTKRGEDARLRLDVLTESTDAWRRAVYQIARTAAPVRVRTAAGNATSRNDEYILYQTLLACWPLDSDGEPVPGDEELTARVREYMVKAAREAKLRTSWIHPDAEYEEALTAFVDRLVLGRAAARFRTAFFPLIKSCARAAALHGLRQTACKCAAPGVPDVYQGTEFWDLSLVDPDNRRPVDYALRAAHLAEIADLIDPAREPSGRDARVRALLDRWPDGVVKQYVLARCLRWRATHAPLFLDGEYVPLAFDSAPDWIGFERRLGDAALAVCFPVRHAASLPEENASLELSAGWAGRRARHLFTGTVFTPKPGDGGPRIALSALTDEFPVAWLWRTDSPNERRETS